ncbi:MAG: transpeptidase family protein [Bacteroidaceae bacterium]|nr:transpeptidase family protein [Bacteroidaceae bacterium]
MASNKDTMNEQNSGRKATKPNTGIKRFRIAFFLFCFAGIVVAGTALYTMLSKRDYWEEVRNQFTKRDIVDPAIRGNIYDSNYRLLVGSVPEYRLCIDFKVIDKDSIARKKAQKWRDSAFVHNVDSIAIGLHSIFPDYTEEFFRNRLREGFSKKKNGWCILPRHMASFIEYQECKKLPLLRESSYKGGFHGDKTMTRKKPYGSLASRTLGTLYKDSDRVAKNGIELAYDSILRGKDGVKHNTKIRNARVDFTDLAPVNGNDIMTTIDVNIQDIAEKAIMKQLKNLGAEMGIVIVMEAKTGDVKAIVNMSRLESGDYAEIMNYAVAERMEPGSTFKTASIMVGLDDGKFTKDTKVETGNGQCKMYNCIMKDWNWATKGGFGTIDVKTVMEQSSNVGVSKLIDKYYANCPKDFTDGLERVGAGIPLELPIPGSHDAIMKKDPLDVRVWSKTTLPWMSIGYESLLPPISTCAFYNGIANHGKLLKPRFVKAEMKEGKVVKEFPVEVLREKMCKESTLDEIYDILENVVSAPNGTGKKARCPFRVCGKTGTAQIAVSGGKGYHTGTVRYLISFCGFFPAEDPQYTCLVCIRKYGLPASGGGHCGPVFAEVARAVMASGMNHRIPSEACDSTAKMHPTIKNGNTKETEMVMKELNLYCTTKATTSKTKASTYSWSKANEGNGKTELAEIPVEKGKMPSVLGMGARDAVFALQTVGLRAKITGAGSVTSQSISPGSEVKEGTVVQLALGK